MGLEQLKKLPEMENARRQNFKKLNDIFRPYGKFFHLPAPTHKSDPCWFAYLLTVKKEAPFKKQDIVSYLENGKIQTRSYFAGNLLTHPGYYHMGAEYGDMNEVFPNAQLVTTNSFFLGTFIGITDEKINYIKNVVDSFFKEKI